MKSIALIVFLFAFSLLTFAQDTDLARQHSLLTTDCKNIRGHAGRIVAEASERQLNRDVALAHLGEVAKFHELMEKQLVTSKKLLTAGDLKVVAAEYKSLEATCSAIGKLVEKLQKEFEKSEPDKLAIRDMAVKLRSEMSDGYDVHERLKKKLGIS